MQTYTPAFHVKWKGCISISLHTWHRCYCLPTRLFEVGGILHGSFFYVLCKSCGEITQARSPPFVTDGKPFQRDYNVLDLLSFLISFKAQVSVICQPSSGLPWQRCTCLGSPLAGERMKFPVMTSLSLPFTAVRQHNDTMATFEMHPNSALLGLVTTISEAL